MESKVINELYDFARERLSDADVNMGSPRDRWKQTGKKELLADLFRFLKELRIEYETKGLRIEGIKK